MRRLLLLILMLLPLGLGVTRAQGGGGPDSRFHTERQPDANTIDIFKTKTKQLVDDLKNNRQWLKEYNDTLLYAALDSSTSHINDYKTKVFLLQYGAHLDVCKGDAVVDSLSAHYKKLVEISDAFISSFVDETTETGTEANQASNNKNVAALSAQVVDTDAATQGNTDDPNQNSWPWWLIAVIVVLASIFCAAISYLLYQLYASYKHDDDENARQTENTVPQAMPLQAAQTPEVDHHNAHINALYENINKLQGVVVSLSARCDQLESNIVAMRNRISELTLQMQQPKVESDTSHVADHAHEVQGQHSQVAEELSHDDTILFASVDASNRKRLIIGPNNGKRIFAIQTSPSATCGKLVFASNWVTGFESKIVSERRTYLPAEVITVISEVANPQRVSMVSPGTVDKQGEDWVVTTPMTVIFT